MLHAYTMNMEENSFDVLVIGSCMIDMMSYTDHLPLPGETIEGNSFSIGFGGKGANQCVAAARLGAKTAMIARVGDDVFGADTVDNFIKNGVNAEHVQKIEGESTGVATITVDSKGENSIVVVGGANKKLTPDDIVKCSELIGRSKVVVCEAEISLDTIKKALEIARSKKAFTIFTASPASSEIDENILKYVDILCVNESETRTLCGQSESEEVDVTSLLEKMCGEVILTLGSYGALYANQNGDKIRVPAPKVENVVDTTGAGDSFLGALSYFIACRPSLGRVETVEKCCRIAASSVAIKGTQTSYLTKDKLQDVLL